MANVSVRRLDETTLERLRQRAAANGRSMEEEIRQILQVAVAAPRRLGDVALELFGPDNGVELEPPLHVPHEAPSLEQ